MTATKNFNGGAAASTLSSGITSGATVLSVADASTWPTANFNVLIDRGQVGEEKVFCSTRTGNSLTVTRGQDGTTAAAHTSGAAIEHCGFAEDFQWSNDHFQASTNVHGLSGGAAVVGTTQAQTLTNKTLTAPTIGDFTNAGHTHVSTAQGGALTFAGVRAYRTTGQNVPDATLTALTWDAESFDTDSFHDNVTNASRLTVPTGLGGLYSIRASCWFNTANSGGLAVFLQINGAAPYVATGKLTFGVGSQGVTAAIDTFYRLSAGDYVEVLVQAGDTGGGTHAVNNLGASYRTPSFEMVRLGS